MKDTLIDDLEPEELLYRYEITSYGVDYTVDTIVKRITDEVIYIPPFQRSFVWNIAQASKFIESLILGLPVPGIFLSKENKTGRLLIVDGQQRLMSLASFYGGLFKGKEFELIGLNRDPNGLNSDLNGKTYKTLNASDRMRLDDSIIHATVVKQDQPNDEDSSIYLIFERLNTGGKPLTSQEIRASIYYGNFNEFLGELQKLPEWRLVFGKENERLKEQELFLRFFSLLYERKSYQKPLKGFMNAFMSENRNFEKYKREELEDIFKKTIGMFAKTIGAKSFRVGQPLNAAAFEATTIGLAERIRLGEVDPERFEKAYLELIASPNFVEKTKGGTSDEKPLQERIQMAIDKFAKI